VIHPATSGTAPALRDPVNRVSPKAPVLWAAGACIPAVPLGLVLVAARLFDWFDVPLWAFPLYVVVALAYVVGMPFVRYQVHRWESTDDAVYTQTGWLSRERRIAPMSRVQTVDFEQSAVGRVLGLASVTVTTASAAGPLVISAIDKEVADRLVADLTRRTSAEAGDAT
jgi:membrane protein YdbS with pleckstrin-like domain